MGEVRRAVVERDAGGGGESGKDGLAYTPGPGLYGLLRPLSQPHHNS